MQTNRLRAITWLPVRTGRALLLVLSVGLANAQTDAPPDAIQYRKAVFEVMSVHFGAINSALTKGPYVTKEVANNAELVDHLAQLPWHAFVAGTQNTSSRARPEVWTQSESFKKSIEEFQSKTAALSAAAKSDNKAALKVAFDGTAKSCKDCHDKFRAK